MIAGIDIYCKILKEPSLLWWIEIARVRFLLICVSSNRQRNNADSGLFAVASMVAVAYGINPSKLNWNTRRLRLHLIQCFNQLHMKPFPLHQDSSPRVLPQKAYTLTVCMSCKHLFCEKDKQVCINCSGKTSRWLCLGCLLSIN